MNPAIGSNSGLLVALSLSVCGLTSACGGSSSRDLFKDSVATGGALTSGGSSANSGGARPSAGGSSSGGTAGSGALQGTGGSSGASAATSGGTAGAGAAGAGGTSLSSGGASADPSGGKTHSNATGGASNSGGSISSAGQATQGGSMQSGGAGASAGAGGAVDAECVAKSNEICDGVDNNCDGSVDEAEVCPSGCRGIGSVDRPLMLCNRDLTFEAAVKLCGSVGMHLAWPNSAAENAAIFELVTAAEPDLRRVWLGATDAGDEGSWQWITELRYPGEVFWSGAAIEEGGGPVDGSFANWGEARPGAREPGDDCAVLVINRAMIEPGTWGDTSCSSAWPALCEP